MGYWFVEGTNFDLFIDEWSVLLHAYGGRHLLKSKVLPVASDDVAGLTMNWRISPRSSGALKRYLEPGEWQISSTEQEVSTVVRTSTLVADVRAVVDEERWKSILSALSMYASASGAKYYRFAFPVGPLAENIPDTLRSQLSGRLVSASSAQVMTTFKFGQEQPAEVA